MKYTWLRGTWFRSTGLLLTRGSASYAQRILKSSTEYRPVTLVKGALFTRGFVLAGRYTFWRIIYERWCSRCGEGPGPSKRPIKTKLKKKKMHVEKFTCKYSDEEIGKEKRWGFYAI
ncbi:hypothetical protein TNCT_391971 [Trichonephila clavata]|uniref:Uncharacterized protein n=1 Tax=Trichonephila clavata TaxID=2740835 RepID=A0A8X6HKU9_TRICU|nr:hypothetical protein TNCT_391971 [Trichonephila clavata]